MRFPWRSLKQGKRFESTRIVESRLAPGVKYTIAAMTFGRRVELMTRIREMTGRIEFLGASGEAGDKMDAGLLRAEVDRIYLAWGLKAIEGLVVDGRHADPAMLADSGPEELFYEAVAAVRAETGLTETERKN